MRSSLTQAGWRPDAVGLEELFGELGGGLRVVPFATEKIEVDGVAVFRERLPSPEATFA